MKHNELLKKLDHARALKSYKIDCEKGIITVCFDIPTGKPVGFFVSCKDKFLLKTGDANCRIKV